MAEPAPLARRDPARLVRRPPRRGDRRDRRRVFVGFDSPEEALACAVAIQRQLADHRQKAGFAPQVRVGVHAAGATQVGKNFTGKGVHEASRIAALAAGGEIVASRATAAGSRYPVSEPREVEIRGVSEPIEVVTVDWR